MSDIRNVGFDFALSPLGDVAIAGGVGQLADVFGIVKAKLQQVASNDGLFAQVFGDKANTAEFQAVRGQWAIGVFGQLPSGQVISAADMNGADGAYASSTQKIYLSDSLFQSSAAPVNSVLGLAGVLTEETFHWLDDRVGADTQGDEGELAKNLLFGISLSDSELSQIKVESDWGFVQVDGLDVEVEQSSTLEIGRNQDGRMEIFAIGKDSQGQLDNKLYQRYQNQADGSWSEWMWTGRFGKEVEVAQNVDGSMEVFLIGTDNKVWHGSQKAPNSSIGDWKDFGMSAIDIEVGKNASGRLEVFAVNANGDVYNSYQINPRNYTQTTWSSASLMSGNMKAMELEVASNQDGRMELFAVGQDGKLWHRFQSGKDQPFGSWYYMDISVKELEIGKNQDGRLEVFAIRSDGRLVNNWQVVASNSSSWRRTSSLSLSPLSWSDLGINACEIEVTINADQRQEIFAIRSSDNQVMRRYQTGLNQGLNSSGWLDTNLKAMEIETGINKSGRMEVVAFDNLGATRHQFQQNPSNSLNWNGTWQFMGDRFNASFNFKGVDSVAISGLMATSNNLTQLINGQLIGQYKDVDGLVGAYNHCWDFVAYATGIDKSSKYWLTTNWKAGANVMLNGNVAVGTAIATFAGPNGKYNGGAYQHTAIFGGYDTVKGVSGFWVWDQNFDALLNGDRSIKKHFVRNNSSQSSDADNYFVINV